MTGTTPRQSQSGPEGQAAIEPASTEPQLKTGIFEFLASTPFIFYLTAPLIYSLIIPFALLDLFVSVYQAICFRAWNIERVKRADYFVFDRHHLTYLNVVQKFNCTYCSYANGVIAYVSDVASRTEQFWCPIKHATRIRGVHERYRSFLDFGDANGFTGKSEEYRARLGENAIAEKPGRVSPSPTRNC